MKHPYSIALVLLIILPLATSCSTMNWGKPATAGPEISRNTEENDFPDESEDSKESGGWLSRALPDFSSIWERIPPPTEARMKWDERRKRGQSAVGSQSEFYAP
jgi:hypothetical protein